MADTKISALTALTGADSAADDEIAIVDTSATETKRMTRDELQAMVLDSPRPGVATSVSVGDGALPPATAVGANNTAVGAGAGAALTSGAGHTAIGQGAAAAYTTEINGTHVGNLAGGSATGLTATAVGYSAGRYGAGAGNTAIGYNSQSSASRSGVLNTSIGSSALAAVSTGSQNTMAGASAGDAITTAASCSGFGSGSLGALTTGATHVAVGVNAGAAFTTQSNGTHIGYFAGSNATGGQAVAMGRDAGKYGSGDSNTAIGYASQSSASRTGAQNSSLGASSASTLTTGSNNTILGYNAQPSAAGVDNEITLGNSSVATLRCQVTSITALSDARDKRDINDLELGLDYIQQLRPVSWIWDARDGSRVGTKDFGFIAQDLQKAQEDNAAPWVNAVLESNPDRLEAAPGKLLPIAIKAIQELSEHVQSLRAEITDLKSNQ